MGATRAGNLRDRVTIQRKVRVPDGAGGFSSSWEDVQTVWAEALPTGGNERLAAGSLRSKQGWKVTIRFRRDMTNEDRFLLDGKVLAIQSIEDPDRTRERLLALCETGTDG